MGEKYIQLKIEGFAEEADKELACLSLPETMAEPFDPNEIRIISQTYSIDTLITRLKNNEIDMNTAFQRKANLWSVDVQSRLIESLMLKLPLPAFYFDASIDDRWLIVDGLQRLTALQRFVIKEDFTLTGLDIWKEYDNKNLHFSNLPRMMQRRILEANITCFLISPGTPQKVKYNVFKRINTGALSLNEMEIRNALNQGQASVFLKDFTEGNRFRSLIELPDERMEDRELVLRCIAFILTRYTDYESPLGSFLNKAMEELQTLGDAKLKWLEEVICRSLKVSAQLLGKDRFSRSIIDAGIRTRLNSALFEVWVATLSFLSDDEINILLNNQMHLRNDYIQLFFNKTFNDSITSSTASKKAVITRFSNIEQIIKKYIK